MRKTWTAFQDQSIRRYLFHTEFFFFFNLQVVWYQGTVCKPWPPFFQKVVIKVSPRNTRSQSNTTIIWACHCCSKNIGAYIILLLTRLIYYVSFCLISLFWWIWLWLHTRTFLYPSKQSLGGGGVYCWGKELSWIILFLYPFFLSKDKKLPDSKLLETPVWFHLKINPNTIWICAPSSFR